jgi:Arm DNA-binding domain/Phage integrase, N-terminal SAM-like domain
MSEARVRLTLTDITVQKLQPPARGQKMYRDETLPGFGVRVSQAGAKTFVLVHGRERQFTTIGRYPIISLAEARTQAKQLLAKKTLGLLHPKSITLEEAYEKFTTEHVARKRPRTQYDYRRTLERYFLSKLGKERLDKISYERLTELTNPLADTPSEQAHALAVARTFFKCVPDHHGVMRPRHLTAYN